ncbi:MAG: phage tail tape measure protein [Hespellia sp.]|nr:phage tail tape measure protein [Hespellia sp.]
MSDEFKARVQVELDEGSVKQAESQIKNLGKNAKTKVDVEIDSKSVKNGKKVGEDIANQVKSGVSSSKIGEEINNQVSKGTSGLSNLNTSANTTKGIFGNLGASIKSAFANYTGVGAITAGLYELKQVASEAKEAIEDINEATVALQMATNQSYSEVSKMVGTYNKMGQNLGATTTEVTDSADAWLRQGKSMSETNTLIKDSMVLSKVASIDSADSTQYLTSAMKGYKVATEDTLKIVDKLTSVDLVSATDAGGLAEGMSRTANSADLAGVSMDKLLGYLATVGETTQKSMSSVGESFKSIFARMSDIKAGKLSSIGDDGTVEDISNVDVVLSALGIKLRDSNQEFRNFGDVLDEVGGKWSGFSSLQQASISKSFAGTRQAENFKVLMSNYSSAASYAETAANSEGQALEKFNYYADSIEAKKKSLQASFESLATNTFSSDAYGNILDTTKAIIDFTDKTGLLKTALGGLAVAGAVKGFSMIQTGIMQAATQMTNFSNALNIVKKGSIGFDEFEKLQSMTGNLSKSQMSLVLSSASLSNEQKIAMMTARGMSEAEAEVALSTMTANGATATLSGTLKGLYATLSPVLPLLVAIGATVGIVKGFEKLDEAYNLTYKTSLKHTEDSISNIQDLKSEIDSLTSKSDEYKQSLISIGEGYNIDLSSVDSIDDMITQINAIDGIKLVDQVEVDKISSANESLERTLEIKNQLYTDAQKEAADLAKNTLEKTIKSGAFESDAKLRDKYDDKYNMASESNYDNGNLIKATQNNVKAIDEYKAHIEELEAQKAKAVKTESETSDSSVSPSLLSWIQNKNKDSDKISKEISDYESSIKSIQKDITGNETELNTMLQALSVDGEGTEALSGYENEFKSVKSALNDIASMDLTPAQKQLNSIESFFDGSKVKNKVKDILTESAKSGKEVSDIANDMKNLGITSADFDGTNLEIVAKYFKDIAKEAESAAHATNKVDGSIEGVGTALDSVNSGDNFVDMKDYLDKADKWLAQGLTGTDDFKTIEKMITQGTGKSYQEARESLQRYFTTDQNEESEFYGELTRDGVQNFADDFQNLGAQFKTTAEAAKAMGVSTEVFEACMGRISDYNGDEGFEGVKNTFNEMVKSSDELAKGQSALEGLKSISESLGDGNKFENSISKWDSALAGYEDDISSLDPTVIAKIEFEYDLAQLQQEINEAQENWSHGDHSSASGASMNTAKTVYREEREKQTGYNESTDEAYAKSYARIEELQKQFNSDQTDAAREATQEQISAVTDLQNAFQDAFANGKTANWNEFLNSDSIRATIDDIGDELGMTKDELEAAFGFEIPDKEVEVKADTSDAEEKVHHLTSEEFATQISLLLGDDEATPYIEMFNAMSLDPKFCELSAEDQATAVYNAVNDLSLDDKQAILNASDNASGIINGVISNLDVVGQGANGNVTASDNATGTIWSVSGELSALDGKTATTYVNTVHTSSSGETHGGGGGSFATGTMLSPARVSGTAYNVLNYKSAYADGKVALDKNETALVNELGTESIIRNGKWMLIQGGMQQKALKKGDIILNALQTKSLLQTGKAGGHARAYANGTLSNSYAAGGIVGNISAINAPNKESDNDSFSEIFDHVEILLDRMERSLSKLTDSIETYSDNLLKQNSVAQDAINQTRNSLATLQNARDTYMAQADAVGLEDNWKNVVKSGELRISEITDEGLKQRLDDYRKYFELSQDCEDKILDAQKDLLDLAQQKLDNIEKYYQNRYEFNDDFGYKANIDELKKALDEYRTELSNQMDAGIIKQYSNEWFEAMKSISQQTQTILEETWNQLQYVVDGLDRVSSKLDNINSLEESKGNTLSEEDYQKQIDTNNKSIEAQYALRAKYLEQMNVYDVGSSQYEDLADKISKCDDEIFGLREDNEKLKDSIWDVRLTKPLEKLKDAYSQVIDEADQFRGLIDKDSMVAKDGSLTSNGLANIAMIMQGMNASKQIVATYTEALKKLGEALDNGTISQSEYDEQQKDILDTINDSAGATVDYKNELIDIYKEMAKSEVDSQNKRINKMKEYMGTEKEAYEYSEKIRKQSKSANQLKSQIAALQGVTNQSAAKELKRLQQELSDQEKEITDTKKDHEYTLRVDGLDSISDSLSETLDNTLDEITYNAEKQEEIVKEMLGNVLNNYKDVYGKINGIINNTGFQFGDDNKNNISNIGTSEGANNQFDSAITAQPDVKPDDTITDVDTGNINDNTTIDDIVSDISKPIDTENRKVAELTLSKSSMSIQEGGAGSLTVGIRPTDAKNKTVIWTSSNPSVATISSGSVKALKPGSTTITVSSTDGSGLSATCTVSVTEKPKPAPPAPSSGGDGRPYVGDICTLNGSYYYDSWGTSPAGSLYSGVPGGVIIDGYSGSEYGGQSRFHGGYGVHIGSADGIYRDLGWVSLNQLSGYATGTRNATAGLHRVDELGNELKIKSIDQNGKKYTMLEDGDGVLKASMTSKLFDFAENPTDFIAKHMSIPSVEIPSVPDITNRSGEPIVNNYHYDSLLTVNGDIDKEVFPGMKKVLEESWQYNAKKLLKSKNR